MVIKISDLLSGCYTYDDGLVVFEQIKSVLSQDEIAQVSFKGITAASSSFINGAFVPLLDLIGFDAVRTRIKVVDSIVGINKLIKGRLIDENNKRINANKNVQCQKKICINF